MRTGIALIALVSMAFIAMPSTLAAELYKWVDENGTVNYSDKPPSRGKAVQTLGEGRGSLSVVPGMSKEELDSQRERATQQRLQRLERELDDLRAREYARETSPPPPEISEVYVPAYGYPWRPPRRPGMGPPGPPRPAPPRLKPKDPFRPEPPPPQPPAFMRR